MNRFTPRFSPERFAESQRLLAIVSPGVTMTYDRGFWFNWPSGYRYVCKKWVSISQGSHYPKWNRDTFGGGTTMLITSQLIRWAQQLPTCTLRSWKHWCGESVGLNPNALALAIEIGWPEEVPCVMCGRMIGTGDWFDWRGAGINCHGLGCWHDKGCKGQPPENSKRKKAVKA